MQDVELIGGHFVVNTLKDAHSVLELYALRGNRVATINLPGIGTIARDLRQAERVGDVLLVRVVSAARVHLPLRH